MFRSVHPLDAASCRGKGVRDLETCTTPSLGAQENRSSRRWSLLLLSGSSDTDVSKGRQTGGRNEAQIKLTLKGCASQDAGTLRLEESRRALRF